MIILYVRVRDVSLRHGESARCDGKSGLRAAGSRAFSDFSRGDGYIKREKERARYACIRVRQQLFRVRR